MLMISPRHYQSREMTIFSGNKLNLRKFLVLCYIFNQYCASDKGGTGSPIIRLFEYLSIVDTI